MEMKKYKFISASEYCVRVFDGTHDSPKPCEKGYKLLTSKNILAGELDKESAYYISENDYNAINQRSKIHQYDILFSMIGSVGNVCFVKDKNIDFAIKNMGVFSCEDKEKSLYLYYYLQSPFAKKMIDGYLNGAVQKFLGLERLRNFPIKVLSLQTQQKIATVLSSLDDKIALNKKINAKLETMAKRLYDYWFVQFDFPNSEGNPYKSSGGKMVWNEVLKREIPEGWEVKRLGEVCDFRNGINYEKNNSGDKIYKIVNVRNITATTFFLNQNDFDEICLQSKIADNYLIPEISILIARSGSPGATRVIMNVKNNVIFCGFIICMEKFTPKYKFYFTYFLKKLENTNATKTGGSILQNVSQDTLKRLSVIIPPKEMIDEFNEKILPIFNYQLTIQKEIQKLTNLRDRLLPLLMNGQVEVEG